ncbi:hypothetical protein L7F22_056575 [Adiantum nelumboides]|nr:hypothetical protein [Adiantum nelumboides]
MEQEEKEHDDHGKRMHRKQGQVCSPEAKLHQSAMERDKRLAGCEKLESPDNTIDSSFSHMVLDRNLASQHISERRLKALVMEEAEGTVLPKFKCRWAPLPSHIDSSQICQLLCPPPGVRELMIRKGITPRNHCKDNRMAIAQKSALNHAARQAALSMEPRAPVKIYRLKPERSQAFHQADFKLHHSRARQLGKQAKMRLIL